MKRYFMITIFLADTWSWQAWVHAGAHGSNRHVGSVSRSAGGTWPGALAHHPAISGLCGTHADLHEETPGQHGYCESCFAQDGAGPPLQGHEQRARSQGARSASIAPFVMLQVILSAPTRVKLPVAPPATPELHKAAQNGPSDDAEENAKNKVIPQAHLSMSGSSTGGAGTYGVLRAAGGALGLNAMAEASAKDKKAKPLNQALTKFMTAHNPKTAWSHAIVLVSIIGGTVVTLTAVGTYFIASAEAKRLKKAKKNSNLLGGR